MNLLLSCGSCKYSKLAHSVVGSGDWICTNTESTHNDQYVDDDFFCDQYTHPSDISLTN